MKAPLYKLAQLKKMPLHQFMDARTLSWIAENILIDLKNVDNSKIKRRFGKKLVHYTKYLPEKKWYGNKFISNGIHGILHAYRVTCYMAILNKLNNLKLNEKLLLITGMLHDIGRDNDKDNLGHGQRSSAWIIKNKKNIEKQINKKISNREIGLILPAIKLHEFNYNYIPIKDLNKVQLKYLNVLKTADALDRYRLPKIKWWLNDSYLKLKPSKTVKKFAFDFIVATEKNKLKSLSVKKSMLCFLQI